MCKSVTAGANIFFERKSVLLAICLFISMLGYCQNAKVFNIPRPVGYVNDFEKIFSSRQVNFLDSLLVAYERKTSIEIIVITIDTAMVPDEQFGQYVLAVLNNWGVGKKDRNNGIAIGISAGYRRMRIQNGYGIEKKLTDAETKSIIEAAFVPEFRKGNYFDGVYNGLRALLKRLDELFR